MPRACRSRPACCATPSQSTTRPQRCWTMRAPRSTWHRRTSCSPRRASAALDKLDELLDALEISSWFSERFDGGDAILTVNPGSGGLEAQDWTDMLYRMYVRYAEKKDWKVTVLDVVPGGGHRAGQGHHPDRRTQRLRHAEKRERRAPPRAHQPHRRQEAPSHHVRGRGGAAGAARRHRGGSQPRRRARGRVPLQRPRRPVRQHHRLGRAPYAHPHEHRW